MIYKKVLAITVCWLLSHSAYAIDDSAQALMLAMKAKALVGHKNTNIPPGNQDMKMRHGRGGISPMSDNHAPCGGVSIGNVAPVPGDFKAHTTTVIIQGPIVNTGNRC